MRAKEAALQHFIARKERAEELLKAISAAAIPATALSAAQVQALAQHKDKKIAALAKVALAAVIPPSRAEAVAKFQPAAALKGDAARGQVQFLQRCMVCHRAAGQGMEVGPALLTVKAKGRDALLTAILEPNKEVAAQYLLYMVNTKDGEMFAGFVAEDNANGMTLKMAGGTTQTVARGKIQGTSSSGQSLMPEGLEAGMSVQEMADLLTFIEELK
jgi:putative heme-binding domain-containing protein